MQGVLNCLHTARFLKLVLPEESGISIRLLGDPQRGRNAELVQGCTSEMPPPEHGALYQPTAAAITKVPSLPFAESYGSVAICEGR